MQFFRTLGRIIGQIAGWGLALFGLFSPDEALKWSEPYLANHWVRALIGFVGLLILVHAYGRWWGERLTKKPPANFKLWDTVPSPAIWQVSWLWNELEPLTPGSAGTPAYPSYQRLKSDLRKGLVRGAEKVEDSWMQCSPDKQAMIDYSIEIGERPKYLFRYRRTAWGRLCHRLSRKEVPAADMQNFQPFGNLQVSLYRAADGDMNKAYIELHTRFLSGQSAAIARRFEDGVLYPYEYLSKLSWHAMRLTWEGPKDGPIRYEQMRVKLMAG